ncbi:hypothetical protein AB4074_10130 [Arthrobacter sp. 2MCAF14]
MSGKNCEECKETFEPSRTSQRFCSARCANRKRDRRRRNRTAGASPALPFAAAQDRVIEPAAHLGNPGARLIADLAVSKQNQNFLHAHLRSQSAAVDHLEAENGEQRATIKSLQTEISRLKTSQRADAHDLVHLASRLLALARATGAELDNTVMELFRGHGWMNTARKTGAKQR